MPEIGAAPILSLIVGVFHTALYVVIRGTASRTLLPLILIAAVLGAYAGSAVSARLADPIRIGDFGVVTASVFAWAGILLIVVASVLGPSREAR